jgi:hypothetical protein
MRVGWLLFLFAGIGVGVGLSSLWGRLLLSELSRTEQSPEESTPESYDDVAVRESELPQSNAGARSASEMLVTPLSAGGALSDSERKELERFRSERKRARLRRQLTSYGTLEDVIADPSLNPRGRELDKGQRKILGELISSLEEKRSIAEDQLGELQRTVVMRKLEAGQYRVQTEREDPHGPNGATRYFTQRDGIAAVVDLYPGEDLELSHAQAELDLVILEGSEEIRSAIESL